MAHFSLKAVSFPLGCPLLLTSSRLNIQLEEPQESMMELLTWTGDIARAQHIRGFKGHTCMKSQKHCHEQES